MSWKDTDSYYQSLTPEDRIAFDTGKNFNDNRFHGSTLDCPTCKMTRVTSVSVCGCGSCKTCGHRFTCYGGSITPSDATYTLPSDGNFTDKVMLIDYNTMGTTETPIVASGSYTPWRDLSYGYYIGFDSIKIGKF